jgi:hypothetical protein
MLKKVFLGILLLNLSVLYSSNNNFDYLNNQQIVKVNNYSSCVNHNVSGTVLHIERKATDEENLLAAKKAQIELDYLNRPYKPFLEELFEPIYTNLEYVACAKPFGISNGKILSLGMIGYVGYSIYQNYKNNQQEAVTVE